jgi:hypothetical protein
MVRQTMKKYTFVDAGIETCKTYDGDNILFHKKVVTDWAKSNFNKSKIELSEEDKNEFFEMQIEYIDVFREIWNNPLYNISDLNWTLPDRIKTPVEEYEHFVTLNKDEDFTDEEHEIKEISLREYKEWYENKFK